MLVTVAKNNSRAQSLASVEDERPFGGRVSVEVGPIEVSGPILLGRSSSDAWVQEGGCFG